MINQLLNKACHIFQSSFSVFVPLFHSVCLLVSLVLSLSLYFSLSLSVCLVLLSLSLPLSLSLSLSLSPSQCLSVHVMPLSYFSYPCTSSSNTNSGLWKGLCRLFSLCFSAQLLFQYPRYDMSQILPAGQSASHCNYLVITASCLFCVFLYPGKFVVNEFFRI